MFELILTAVVAVTIFVTGVLVGRKNPTAVNTVVTDAQSIAAAVEAAVKKAVAEGKVVVADIEKK